MTDKNGPRAGTADVSPAAISDDWEWQLHGACRGRDVEMFFHPYGEREPSRSRRERAAQSICAICPVRQRCADYAVAAHEPYGVWGGLTETDRQQLWSLEERPHAGRHRPAIA